ncbi:hypothetical protein [Serratia phage vB_SmaM_Yaphecito]|uniref:Uncharacterized protein n=1 Tax=Serratia phage vB_SmaM_Yaphecito TaxID=2777368 RepID=A0A7T3NC83_9CAUD|nr:hypothetical protein [Serratia phage vB_SmaM_Yaphecito]
MASKSRIKRIESKKLNATPSAPIKDSVALNPDDMDKMSSKTIARLERRTKLIY